MKTTYYLLNTSVAYPYIIQWNIVHTLHQIEDIQNIVYHNIDVRSFPPTLRLHWIKMCTYIARNSIEWKCYAVCHIYTVKNIHAFYRSNIFHIYENFALIVYRWNSQTFSETHKLFPIFKKNIHIFKQIVSDGNRLLGHFFFPSV